MKRKTPNAWPGLKIALRNFKAFQDSGEITIAPITLVFGENSVGKSTIVQALMSQLGGLDGPYDDIGIKLDTKALSVRSFSQVARDKSRSFSIARTLPTKALTGFWEQFESITEEKIFEVAEDGVDISLSQLNYSGVFADDPSPKTLKLGTLKRFTRKISDLKSADPNVRLHDVRQLNAKPPQDHVVTYYRWTNWTSDKEFWSKCFHHAQDLLNTTWAELKDDDRFEYRHLQTDLEKRPESELAKRVELFKCATPSKFQRLMRYFLLNEAFRPGGNPNFMRTSMWPQFDIWDEFFFFWEIVDGERIEDIYSLNIDNISELPRLFFDHTKEVECRYLGAYRERVPDLVQRKLGGGSPGDVRSTYSDAQLVESLTKTLQSLNLPYSVITQDLEGTDYFKIWLYDKKRKARRHPSDVGFGIGQIVQIAADFYSDRSNNSGARLQVIEEPEAHLHPTLQANLATILNPNHMSGCNFLIETHSEPLVLGYLDLVKQGFLEPNLLSIVHIEAQGNSSKATCYEIDADGEFIGGWPDKLFPIVT